MAQGLTLLRPRSCLHPRPLHTAALHIKRGDVLPPLKTHTGGLGHGHQAGAEQVAVAGFVVGQAQAPGQARQSVGQARLNARQLFSAEQLKRHAAVAQHRNVLLRGIELGLCAKQLQSAALAIFIAQARVGPQLAQHIAAVVGQAHHAFFVGGVVGPIALGQHAHQPAQLEQAAVRAQAQRGMFLKQPLDRLQRNAGGRPRRGVTRRDLPGVGKAGLHGGATLAVDHRDLGPGAGQKIGGGGANDTRTQNKDFHGNSLLNMQRNGF